MWALELDHHVLTLTLGSLLNLSVPHPYIGDNYSPLLGGIWALQELIHITQLEEHLAGSCYYPCPVCLQAQATANCWNESYNQAAWTLYITVGFKPSGPAVLLNNSPSLILLRIILDQPALWGPQIVITSTCNLPYKSIRVWSYPYFIPSRLGGEGLLPPEAHGFTPFFSIPSTTFSGSTLI